MIELGCVFALGGGVGGALIWFFKSRLQTLVVDADVLATKLRDEANAIASITRKV